MKNRTLKSAKGYEFSSQYVSYIKALKKDKRTTVFWQLFLFVALLGIWELFTHIGILDPFFTSSPSRIAVTLWDLVISGQIFYHSFVTLYETVVGFLLSMVLGTVIAIIFWWSKKIRDILDPYIVVLNSLPKIALGPLIIIWVGAGTSSILTMCVLICIVITILTMLSAFLSCDKDKINLMKSMGASKWQIFFKLVLPNSRNEFIALLKINVGMSWVGTIMGEYLVTKAGLGYLITYGSQVFKLDLVMTSIVVLCLLACLMYFIVGKIEKRFSH